MRPRYELLSCSVLRVLLKCLSFSYYSWEENPLRYPAFLAFYCSLADVADLPGTKACRTDGLSSHHNKVPAIRTPTAPSRGRPVSRLKESPAIWVAMMTTAKSHPQCRRRYHPSAAPSKSKLRSSIGIPMSLPRGAICAWAAGFKRHIASSTAPGMVNVAPAMAAINAPKTRNAPIDLSESSDGGRIGECMLHCYNGGRPFSTISTKAWW